MIGKYFFIVLILYEILYGQIRIPEFELHDRGELWDTMNDDGTHGAYPQPLGDFKPSMDWPAGPHEFNSPYDQRSYLYKAGVWTGGKINGEVFLSKNGPFEIDNGDYFPLEKTTNYIESVDYRHDEAEQTITANWITSKNIEIKRISRSWSFKGFNDFIIFDYEIKNLNQEKINDFYFGSVFLLRPSSQDFNSHAGWNDNISRADDVVGIDLEQKMIYAHDGTGSYDFNAGVGNWRDGELLTHGFAGFAAIDASNSDDGVDQPAVLYLSNYIINRANFELSTRTQQSLYSILSGQDSSLISSTGDTIDPIGIMSFGPYTINSQGSISISIVEAVNGLVYDDVINLDNSQMNTIQDRYINEGLDSLINSIQRAKDLFHSEFILPFYPPPSPPKIELLASPSNQSISILWDPIEAQWINPLTGRKNLEKFIVYRSNTNYIGPFDVIKNRIRVHKIFDQNAYFNEQENRWEYIDRNISLGVSYYYSITSVDSSGRESWHTNRNETPLQAVSAPKENALNIKVFPNPFQIISGIPTAGQENMITWTNLPSPCKISIFTSGGKLIKEIFHKGLTGDASWNQRTDSRLITSPGIYFWGVESDVGNAKGTLVIVK
tara:strand:+ start:8391 stop:10214 length:1824 start_codon:yes stop_codon:yes gene_type:complete